MTKYIAKDGERLDQIVYAHYGSLARFSEVLAVNYDLEPILSAGDAVLLPEFSEEKSEGNPLW